MKKLLFTLSFLFLLSATVSAQGLFGQWKLSKIGVSNGSEQDMVRGMDYSYFADQIPDSEDFALRDESFDDSDFYDMACENPEFAVSLGLSNPRFPYWEWTNSIRYKFNRRDNVSYHSVNGVNSGGTGRYVSFNGSHNELAFDTKLGRTITIVNGLNITPAIGSNLGIGHNSRVCVREVVGVDRNELGQRSNGLVEIPENYEPINECFYTGASVNHRLYLELKGSLVVKKRVELFMAVRKGVGYRVAGGNFSGTQGNMFNLGINVLFNNFYPSGA